MSLRESRLRTLHDHEKYFDELNSREHLHQKLRVQMGNRIEVDSPVITSHAYDDLFKFRKEGNIWRLNYFLIKRDSFGFYSFEGVKKPNGKKTGAISGIYCESSSN